MKRSMYMIMLMVSVLLILSGCKEKSTIISEKVIEQEGYSKSIETKKITYLSDGLEVVGYLVKPISIEGQLPVIIYNHFTGCDHRQDGLAMVSSSVTL